MKSLACPISQQPVHMSSKMVVATTILVALLFSLGVLFQNNVYAEDPKEIYEKAKLDAEIEFAETIQVAKAQYYEIVNDPNTDSKTKQQAKQDYNKTIEEAKILRDQKIDDARKAYEIALQTDVELSLTEARKKFLQKIDNARKEYEAALNDAQEKFDDAISKSTDEETEEQLEEEYERTLSQIKQIYNDAIAEAQKEYEKIKNSEVK